MNYRKISRIALFLLAAGFLCLPVAAARADSDAIAIRVLPNPDHLSISRWYDNQGFTGAPQELTVDGYEAIRDGRTVYVNAANIDNASKTIYSNVYLISYTQEASENTADILGQLIKNWSFNTNIEGDKDAAGVAATCSLSSLSCAADADCGTGARCVSGTCQLSQTKYCRNDEACPAGFFCDSLKAQASRDLKRLAYLETIKNALASYKAKSGFYPALSEGTYIAGASLSSWPSWNENFLPALALKSGLADPINKLGACSGYDPKTCWNATTSKFIYDPADSYLKLPAGSYALAYKLDASGGYHICSVLETKAAGYQFSGTQISGSDCVLGTGVQTSGGTGNSAPILSAAYLSGRAGEEFDGTLMAYDADGNPVSWNLDFSGSSWAGWSAKPAVSNGASLYEKKLYAVKAGKAGSYPVKVSLDDGQGGTYSTTTSIVISNSGPIIEAGDGDFFPSATNNTFKYSFYIQDANLVPASKTYQLQVSEGGIMPIILDNNYSTITQVGISRYQVTYALPISVLFSDSFNLSSSQTLPVNIIAWDSLGQGSNKEAFIRVNAVAPTLSFSCPSKTRVGNYYACTIGALSQDDHILSYAASAPSNLQVVTDSTSAYLRGAVSAAGNYSVSITAKNEAGTVNTGTFPLAVQTYCGDGVKQSPNDERTGGPENNGNEDCDGNDGIALTPASSSLSKQYGCTTEAGDTTPNPIINKSYCSFAASDSGSGGYCGDGICQANVDRDGQTTAMENCSDCSADCGSCAVCGNGKVEGDEVCEVGDTQACSGTFNDPTLPSYCKNGITLQGKKTCKNDCSGWGDCQLDAPQTIRTSQEACLSVNTTVTNVACCALEACVNDTCGCCGRKSGEFDYVDFSKISDYTIQAFLSPGFIPSYSEYWNIGVQTPYTSSSTRQICTKGSYSNVLCQCGTTDCTASPLCYENAPQCAVGQSDSNGSTWQIFSNHTTAYYKCWK